MAKIPKQKAKELAIESIIRIMTELKITRLDLLDYLAKQAKNKK